MNRMEKEENEQRKGEEVQFRREAHLLQAPQFHTSRHTHTQLRALSLLFIQKKPRRLRTKECAGRRN